MIVWTARQQRRRSLKKKNRPDLAAISSEWVAGIYGLKVIEKDIQDSACNHTRFIVISKSSIIQPNQEKTMLLVTPQEEYVGMLASILNVFSTLSINLTWIESRPTRKKNLERIFFLLKRKQVTVSSGWIKCSAFCGHSGTTLTCSAATARRCCNT
ncbi:prephenate dehydratase domain-containing protein [Terrilactibacillus sp. S3-3]|nr:prephenate dehydratase domain-containing protein [Terrilactibacillus sp. S3-3]